MASLSLQDGLLGPARADERRLLTIHDNKAYAKGPYLAYIAPFNKGENRFGTDYTESITIRRHHFPAQSVFAWRWPDVPAPPGVYDFSAIDYGNYNNTIVPTPIPSRRIGAIRKLRVTHDALFAGQLQGFDVIDDLFLTTSAGDSATKECEIEVFLHTPDYSAFYVPNSQPIGTFRGSGITWTVTIANSGTLPDVLFMPADAADVPRGTIDLKDMLDYLVEQGTIPGTLYFNGLALGTETRQGSGSMTLRSFAVDYD